MYKKILTVQDISCVGQCSITVALPIISACSHECCILPSAILSTHTGGFNGFTFKDLSDEIPKVIGHWAKENIKFDAVYTGYLGNSSHADYVLDIANRLKADGGKLIVDPAMADNGKLYYGFDDEYVESIRKLCGGADIILPNLTEACLLVGEEYPEEYGEAFISSLLVKLSDSFSCAVVLTGVSFDADSTGVKIFEAGRESYYKHKKIPQSFHGTGDVYAASFVGAYLQGKELFEAAKIAADITVKAIENTLADKSHWYGVKFETALPELITKLDLN